MRSSSEAKSDSRRPSCLWAGIAGRTHRIASCCATLRRSLTKLVRSANDRPICDTRRIPKVHPARTAPESPPSVARQTNSKQAKSRQKALITLFRLTDMKRRAFLTGTTGALAVLAGCTSDSPSTSESNPAGGISAESPSQERSKGTSEPTTVQTKSNTESPSGTTTSQQRRKMACSGARYIEFYALGSEVADEMWSPSTVRVGFGLGAGADVLLVVLENNTVLGMTRIKTPNDSGIESDGDPIPLNTKLSGEHTIRVVMYPDAGKENQFNAQKTVPCQYEGKAVQTEPTTIDFSRFSENTSPTPSGKLKPHRTARRTSRGQSRRSAALPNLP